MKEDLRTLFQDDAGSASADMIVGLLISLQENQEKIVGILCECSETLKEHTGKDDALFERILGAFPGEDAYGHRRYHEAVIERQKIENKLIRACLTKAAEVGFVAGLGWLLYAVWIQLTADILHK